MCSLGTPTICNVRAWAARLFDAAGVDVSGLEADLLLAHTLGGNRAAILAHPEWSLDAVALAVYEAYVARRARREPYAYIVGHKEWLDFDLAVDRNVLIPRPETETLAMLAIEETHRQAARLGRPAVVIDVGTGSGALAIALARAGSAQVLASESSTGALATASRNTARLAPGRIEPRQTDLLAGMPAPNVLVANLPYIPTADLATLAPELAFEPRAALDGGPDGLAVIRALIAQARSMLAAGATILLECGHDQADAVARLLRAAWPDAAIERACDLAGIERFVTARIA